MGTLPQGGADVMFGVKPFEHVAPLRPGLRCLEASAGTGKTYAISGLVLRLLAEQGLEINEILVVTYTRAATAELRDRIRRILVEALEALEEQELNDHDESRHQAVLHLVELGRDETRRQEMLRRLRRAYEGFDEATITTIHGFCKRVLRRHAFESGVSLGGDDLEDMTTLINEVTADWWSAACFEADPFVVQHMEKRGVDPKHLHLLLKEVLKSPGVALTPTRHPGVDVTQLRQQWREAREEYRREHEAHIDSAIALLDEVIHADVRTLNAPFRDMTRTLMSRDAREAWLDGPEPYPEVVEHLSDISGTTIRKKTGKGKVSPVHPLFEATDRLLEHISTLQGGLDMLVENKLHDYREGAESALAEVKRLRDLQSYDDLLTQLHRCVHGEGRRSTLIHAVGKEYRAALIDEFQDTDGLQWDIFRELFATPDHFLYIVGDPKQAIYGFRGADIEAYLSARSHPEMTVNALDQNYRSDGAMVRAINTLFRATPEPFKNRAISFDAVTAAKPETRIWSNDQQQPALVWNYYHRALTGAKPSTPIALKTSGKIERWVATDIAHHLNGDIKIDDGETPRPLRPSDIAVLTRGNQQAADIQHALRDVGVPSVLEHSASVFATDEAGAMLTWLEAVLEPSRAGRFRASLIGPLIGGDTSWLTRLDSDDAWLDEWMRRFHRWKLTWCERGFAACFRQWLLDAIPNRDGGEAPPIVTLLSVQSGERCVTNLLQLSELLHRASVEQNLDPQGLLGWLREHIAHPSGDVDDNEVRLESDADAVTIVTVHKSKGLEYPVVWAPYIGLGSQRTQTTQKPLRYRGADDLERVDIHLDPKHPKREEHRALAVQEEQAQELRLAYVALTRARHQCHLIWGPIRTANHSPLAHLLGSKTAPIEAQDDEALLSQLEALAADSRGAMTFKVHRAAPHPGRYRPQEGDQESLQYRRWRRTRPLDRTWRRSSFSALIAQGRLDDPDDFAPRDHDPLAPHTRELGAPTLTGREGEVNEVILADFPKGAQAGSCIHSVYEHLDFQRLEMLEALCDETLARFGFEGKRWTATLTEAVTQSLRTPLNSAGDVRLETLALTERFDELDFTLVTASHSRGATAKDIAEAMTRYSNSPNVKAYAEQLRRLDFDPVRGFLVGSIDLVFRHDGRFYVVDYKSNHLGRANDDYHQTAMQHAMAEHHYILQYHLYTVALHRYLKWRIPSYNYERDVGGVYYLFLRGMSPTSGPERGVYFDQPSSTLIHALDSLLMGAK